MAKAFITSAVSNSPLQYPLSSGISEQFAGHAVNVSRSWSPAQENTFKAACVEAVKVHKPQADTASSSASKPAPRRTRPMPCSGHMKYTCTKCGLVSHSTSIPDGGTCCNQQVEEYSEAPTEHVDTPPNSFAEPAPACASVRSLDL